MRKRKGKGVARRKRCSECGRRRRTKLFGPNKQSADGLNYRCNPCRSSYEGRRRRRAGACRRRKYRDGGGRKECRRCGKRRLLRLFSPASRGAMGLSAWCRRCAARNGRSRDLAGYVRGWRLGNNRWALQHRLHQRVRKARVANGDLTVDQAGRILSGRTCFYCKRLVRRRFRTLDHKTPLSRGGKHTVSNVVMACGRCNSRKRDMTAREFFKRMAEDEDGV